MDRNGDKLILYNNDTCTWSNRAKIVLLELGLPFEERYINVDGSRPASFLQLNPRALVPVLLVNDDKTVVIESAIICQFLCDVHPSHLCPPADTLAGALSRARLSFFVDAYWSKFHVVLFRLFEAASKGEAERVVEDAVGGAVREVDGLLTDAGPFVGGSDRLTLAECITGPFVIRAFALSRHGVYPKSLVKKLEEKAPNFFRWATAVCSHPSVLAVFPGEEVIVQRSWNKRDRMRAAAGLTEDWVKR